MSIVDDFLKKMKMVSDDDYDDYDEYDEDDEIISPDDSDDYDDVEDYDDDDDYVAKKPVKTAPVYTAPVQETPVQSAPAAGVVGMRKPAGKGSAEVCMIMPKNFEDANTIADVLLSKRAVVLNLEDIDIASAQRIIDFASGACYTVGGNLQKISKKIFIVVPSDMNLSGDFDELIGDMIDLNSVNMMK